MERAIECYSIGEDWESWIVVGTHNMRVAHKRFRELLEDEGDIDTDIDTLKFTKRYCVEYTPDEWKKMFNRTYVNDDWTYLLHDDQIPIKDIKRRIKCIDIDIS